jgi:hypothetical protein
MHHRVIGAARVSVPGRQGELTRVTDVAPAEKLEQTGPCRALEPGGFHDREGFLSRNNDDPSRS